VFRVKDPRGRNVILKKSIWKGHITDKRPELVPYLPNLRRTIKDPDIITESKKCSDCEFFIRASEIRSGSFKYMNIVAVVEWIKKDPYEGLVKTAYITPETRGGKVKWQRPMNRP